MSVLLPSSTEPAVEKRRRLILEIALALLNLHGTFLIVVDHAVLAFGAADEFHFVDDFFNGVGFRADGAGARTAPERSHAGHHHFRFFKRSDDEILFDRYQRASPDHHGPRFGVIERHDRNVLAPDVLPDVEFGPVGEREDADVLALIHPGVVEVPEFGALIFRIPLAKLIAEGIDAFLGAGLLFVPPRPPECGVVTTGGETVEQRAGLQETAAFPVSYTHLT